MALSNNKFCLLGYSGHAYVVADSILSRGDEIIGYFEIIPRKLDPYQLKYLGSEDSLRTFSGLVDEILFPSVGNPEVRFKMVELIEGCGLKQGVVIHKTATISSKSSLGLSTLVAPGVVVNSCAKIGNGSILNTASIIEHECVVGDFSHIAPSAVLAGNVTVGDFTFIGANSTVKQGVKIGNNVTIGAGSVILTDVSDNETWVGNPGRRVK